jgi:hypothetical protein
MILPIQVAMDAELLTCAFCGKSAVTEVVKAQHQLARKINILGPQEKKPNESDDPKGE